MAITRTLFATDPRTIAQRYFWSGLIFLAIGGALAMVMRWHWAYPKVGLPLYGPLSPGGYAALFSSHGLIMIFFAITPLLLGAFGNLCIPLAIGVRTMAFPRLNALAFFLMLAGQLVALISLLAPAVAPAAAWTMYPPLSTGLSNPGPGMTLMIVAVGLSGLLTTLSAVNLLTTVVVKRAPEQSFMRLPLTVWGLFLTSVLNVLFAPVLLAACLLLLVDRLFGYGFFAAQTGDPLLYQHLFWIFGHPEVYILILPVWGIVADLIADYSGKRPHWYRGTVYAFLAVTVLSGLVYGHHLFQAGISPLFGTVFVLFTLAISVPSVVIAVNWFMTLRGGAIRFPPAMVFALGAIVVFGIGGLTGMPLASVVSDLHLHDTLWVVGHFHLIMAAATLLGSFAAIYHFAPKLFGMSFHSGLGLAHALGTLVFALLTFGGLLASGYGGQLRRLADPAVYSFTSHLAKLNVLMSHSAFVLGAFQLVFFANLVWSLRRRHGADETIESVPEHPADPERSERIGAILFLIIGATVLLSVLLAAGAVRSVGAVRPVLSPVFGAAATVFIGLSSLLAVLARPRLAFAAGAGFLLVQGALLASEPGISATLLTGLHALLAMVVLSRIGKAAVWKTSWHVIGGLWLCVAAFLYF